MRRTFYDMQEYLFGHDALDRNSVCLEDIIRNLQRTPFLLKTDEANQIALSMRRISHIKSETEMNDIHVMVHAFKKIIGENYDTYTEQEEIEVERAVYKKCFKDREADLKDTFKKHLNKTG